MFSPDIAEGQHVPSRHKVVGAQTRIGSAWWTHGQSARDVGSFIPPGRRALAASLARFVGGLDHELE